FPANPHSVQSRFDVMVSSQSVNSPSQSFCVPEQPFGSVHALDGPQDPGQPSTGHAFSLGGECLLLAPASALVAEVVCAGDFFRPSPPHPNRVSETTQTSCRCTEPPPFLLGQCARGQVEPSSRPSRARKSNDWEPTLGLQLLLAPATRLPERQLLRRERESPVRPTSES